MWFNSLPRYLGFTVVMKQQKLKNDGGKCLCLPVSSYSPVRHVHVLSMLYTVLWMVIKYQHLMLRCK